MTGCFTEPLPALVDLEEQKRGESFLPGRVI